VAGIRLFDERALAKVRAKLREIAEERDLAGVRKKAKILQRVRSRIQTISGQRELAGAGK